MQITVDRKHLLNKVDLLKGITRLKNEHMPILRNVLIELGNGSGKISATDLEISAITAFKSGYDGPPVKIIVKGSTLQEVLCTIKGQNIDITYPAEFPEDTIAGNMVITQGRIEIGLAIGDPQEFPEIPVVNEVESVKLSAKDLLAGIHKVLYAVSADDERPVLTGMLMQVKDGKLVMCGTDGFRMALWKKDLKDEDDTPQIVIPARNVKILKQILGDTMNVGVVIADDRVQMMTENVTAIARTLSLAFPEYENVVAAPKWDHIALVRRAEFLNCLNRMVAAGGGHATVLLHRVEGGLNIQTEGEAGYCHDTIDCTYKSDAPLYTLQSQVSRGRPRTPRWRRDHGEVSGNLRGRRYR